MSSAIPANPLAKYFRAPGVHVKLPTNGAFLPPGALELEMDGSVAVYPMRSADELLLKSPDALLSGSAIEKLLASCVPSIKTPRYVSSPDLDVLLVAIKAATFGEVMTLSAKCPECQAEQEIHRSLSALLGTASTVDPEISVRLTDDIVVYLRPHNLEDATRLGLAGFDEARRLQALDQNETADVIERNRQISQSMGKLAELTTEITARCVIRVVVPEGVVTDPHMIGEFVMNSSKTVTDRVQEALDTVNAKGIDKKFPVTCAACEHEWQSQIDFDPSSFFADTSSAS